MPAVTADALEQEYRRIVHRWYPPAWTAANGDALVGTLLDTAEHQGALAVTAHARFNLVRHGVALRMTATLTEDVRCNLASVGAGAVIAYTLVLVFVGAQGRGFAEKGVPALELIGALSAGVGLPPDPARLLALTPTLIVWLLVAVSAVCTRRQLTAVALSVAVVVTIVCSPLWFNDRFVVPFSYGWENWWRSVAYLLPGSIANLVLLICFGGATLFGRARLKPLTIAALITVVVTAGSVVFRAGRVNSYFPDWFWTPAPSTAQGFVSIPLVLAAVVAAAAILAKTSHRRWALIVLLSAVPVLLGWTTQLVVNPEIYVAL